MKKILSMALIATLSIVVLAGCGASTPEAEGSHNEKVSKEALYVGIDDNEAIIKTIKKAAGATGWKITEFKSNEVVAEKTANGDTISSAIKLYKGYIEFTNEDASELKDAVAQEIKKEDNNLH